MLLLFDVLGVGNRFEPGKHPVNMPLRRIIHKSREGNYFVFVKRWLVSVHGIEYNGIRNWIFLTFFWGDVVYLPNLFAMVIINGISTGEILRLRWDCPLFALFRTTQNLLR